MLANMKMFSPISMQERCMLTAGQKAPDFTLLNQDGEEVSLSQYTGQKVILWFFPKASTPGWTVEGQGFRDELAHFQSKNTVILGMSADSVKRQKNFCVKQQFNYSLLSDPDKNTLKAYGAWGLKKMYGKEYEGIIRCTYVIDESGIIEKVYSKVKTKTHAIDILADLG